MKAHLRPARADLKVPMRSHGEPFPPDGAEVELTTWIARRVRDGDLVAVDKPKAARASAKPRSAEPRTAEEPEPNR